MQGIIYCVLLLVIGYVTSQPPTPEVLSWPNGFFEIPNPPGYEYGPSIIQEDGTLYAFFCAPGDTTQNGWDSIRMVTSKDGFSWTAPVDALEEGNAYDANSVCDPSVVKYHGVYYLYHTCINQVNPPDGYKSNRVCVATADSIAGPYYLKAEPVLADMTCTDSTLYCVGQPAALVYNDTVYLYVSNINSSSFPGPNPGYVYLATSQDGLSFQWQNGQNPVYLQRDVDVKFDRASQQFFMVQGDVGDTHISWSVSTDGINFIPYTLSNTLTTNPGLPSGGSNNNPGIMSESDGTFSGTTFAAYGSSYQVGWGTWHLYRTDFVINPAQNNCTACCSTSCDLACSAGGQTMQGTCKTPGGEDPNHCCSCSTPPVTPDCSQCTSGCVAACRGAGYQMGICAVPGSTTPSDCCACSN